MPETAWMLLGIAVGFMLREYLPVRLPPTVSERERGKAVPTNEGREERQNKDMDSQAEALKSWKR